MRLKLACFLEVCLLPVNIKYDSLCGMVQCVAVSYR